VRSDRHGEMVSMDLLEDAISTVPYENQFQTRMPEGLVLYSQLESCPMCVARLASSSISSVRHGAPDNGGGMAHKLCSLPPIFIGLTSVQKWIPSSISKDLIQLCFDCFGINVGTVGTKQNNRAYGCQTKCPNMNYCLPATSPAMIKRAGYNLSGFLRY
jgi:cytosine deaminase